MSVPKEMRFIAGYCGEYRGYAMLFIREFGKDLLFGKPTIKRQKQIYNILSPIAYRKIGILRVFSAEYFFTGIPGPVFPVSETTPFAKTGYVTDQSEAQCLMRLC
jgi:hypothetical protein